MIAQVIAGNRQIGKAGTVTVIFGGRRETHYVYIAGNAHARAQGRQSFGRHKNILRQFNCRDTEQASYRNAAGIGLYTGNNLVAVKQVDIAGQRAVRHFTRRSDSRQLRIQDAGIGVQLCIGNTRQTRQGHRAADKF